MAWRAIHDTVGRSESLAAVSDLAERLYWRMLAHSDPYGRLQASPAKLRVQCYALLDITDVQAGEAIAELEDVGRIQMFPSDGIPTIQIVDFDENQPGELKRKRGAERISKPQGLNARTRTAYARHVYKLPAKLDDARPTPVNGGPRPAKSRESRERLKAAAEGRAQEDPPDGTPDLVVAAASELEPEGPTLAALVDLLDHWHIGGELRQQAIADPHRALICARRVEAANATNPGGYLRKLLESGDTPILPTAKPDNAQRANVQTADPEKAIAAMIANRVITDPLDLDAELAGYGLNGPSEARLRAMLEQTVKGAGLATDQ